MLRDLPRLLPLIFMLMTASILTGCGDDVGDEVIASPITYDLIWSDEFDGAAGSPPNAANWVFDIGTAVDGWGNFELQYYTDRTENAALDGNGNLVITARRESFEGQDYTSARIKTRQLFEQRYGIFEARIRLPGGQGIWPAFWMLGNNCEGDICQDGQVTWPEVGEIDVVELFGADTKTIATSIHGPGYSAGEAITAKHRLEDNADFTNGFHVFAVEWDPSRIRWYLDGEVVFTVNIDQVILANQGQWVFDRPFFMLLNVAVGGLPVGDPDAFTPLPAEMVVDYVRVYGRRAQ